MSNYTDRPYLESQDISHALQHAAHLADESDHQDKRDDAWVTDKLNKVCVEVDTSLDPAIYAMQWASLPKEDW